MGGGGWKRVALDRNKEKFVRKKNFWFVKMGIFLRTAKKGTCKKNQKARQRFANLWTPGTIQSSAGSNFAENSGGSCRNRFCPQNAGEKALNRCERVTVVQTQDGCFSEKKWCTASSQSVVADKMCDCSLALVRCEIEIIVC